MNEGLIDNAKAAWEKKEIDEKVADRINSEAERDSFRSRLHDNFRGQAEEIIGSMMDYVAANRSTARDYADRWNRLSVQLGTPSPALLNITGDTISNMLRLLDSAKSGDISFTSNQLDRMVSIYLSHQDKLGGDEQQAIEHGLRSLRKGTSDELH
jgi:hypothetical protein